MKYKKKQGGWCPKFGLKVRLSNIFESRGGCSSLSMSSWSDGLYCLSRFHCVWFLGKVSALVVVHFKAKMPQVVHIMPQISYSSHLKWGLSKRSCLLIEVIIVIVVMHLVASNWHV